jgi:hypothetical protein
MLGYLELLPALHEVIIQELIARATIRGDVWSWPERHMFCCYRAFKVLKDQGFIPKAINALELNIYA